MSGSSLTTYDTSCGLDETHHVTMEPEDTVHVWEVPVGEVLGERKGCDRGVQRGIGDLQSHLTSLARLGKNSSRSVLTGADSATWE